jgi:hypothetical protein
MEHVAVLPLSGVVLEHVEAPLHPTVPTGVPPAVLLTVAVNTKVPPVVIDPALSETPVLEGAGLTVSTTELVALAYVSSPL